MSGFTRYQLHELEKEYYEKYSTGLTNRCWHENPWCDCGGIHVRLLSIWERLYNALTTKIHQMQASGDEYDDCETILQIMDEF